MVSLPSDLGGLGESGSRSGSVSGESSSNGRCIGRDIHSLESRLRVDNVKRI